MEGKAKTHSHPKTPLTVKWSRGPVEGQPLEPHPDKDVRRLAILVSGFLIGLGLFGLSSWFLDERFSIVHVLLGGYVTCSWVQRWGEKHLGWRKTQPEGGANEKLRAADIRRRRLAYSVPGIAIGLAGVGLSAWLTGGTNWVFDVFLGSLGGYEAATGFGERFRGLPTLNDLAMARMREGMSPLDLKPDDRVPVTLKTNKESKARR